MDRKDPLRGVVSKSCWDKISVDQTDAINQELITAATTIGSEFLSTLG